MAQRDEILVVTATLGCSPWLGETVESVAALKAAGFPIRHRIAAPGVEVEALRGRFPGCEVVESKAQGIYGALNEAVAGAGTWSAWTWLNDDDSWHPEGARLALETLGREPEADVIYGRVDYIDANGRRLGALPVESDPGRFRSLMAAGIPPLSQHGTLVRRGFAEKLGRFDERFRLAADFDYWARSVATGARFRFVDAVVAEYRLRPGQMSRDTAAVGREIEASRAQALGSVSRLRAMTARAAFRLRHVPELVERLRITGRWRTSSIYADAARGEGGR